MMAHLYLLNSVVSATEVRLRVLKTVAEESNYSRGCCSSVNSTISGNTAAGMPGAGGGIYDLKYCDGEGHIYHCQFDDRKQHIDRPPAEAVLG